MNLPRLMLVTDRRRCLPREVVEVVAAAVEGGVELVQLREKDLPGRELLAIARRLREVTHPCARLLINDRVDIALLCEADGVHLSERGFTVTQARSMRSATTESLHSEKRSMLIGRSIHAVERARATQQDGADYLIAGAIFATSSHLDAKPQGLEFLREVCAAVTIPVFAIGGVTSENAPQCWAAGAYGVAVIGEIMAADDPKQRAQRLVEIVARAMRS